MKIELWVLVDSFGYICYTGSTKEMAENYKDSNGFNDKFVIKLEGELKCPNP